MCNWPFFFPILLHVDFVKILREAEGFVDLDEAEVVILEVFVSRVSRTAIAKAHYIKMCDYRN